MKILVCNAGSTSLKFKLYQMPEEQVLAECRIERIADPKGGRFFYQPFFTSIGKTGFCSHKRLFSRFIRRVCRQPAGCVGAVIVR